MAHESSRFCETALRCWMATLTLFLGHRGINLQSSPVMAEPPPAVILQGLQLHRDLCHAAEYKGLCGEQAWLKQELPLFFYKISSP